MINVTFPDDSIRQYESGINGATIAANISKSLAKSALIVEVNGKQQDLSVPIQADCALKIITVDKEEALETIRHDAAHVLAQAAKELYGDDIQVTIGPSIENGFYYDFVYKTPFSTDDLELLENKMHELVKRDHEFVREVWSREKAIAYFKSIGEHYKVEIIESIPGNEELSIYKQGDFLDLCRGPHGASLGYLKHFKLMKVSGAYWRGDAKNAMLQRIYGTAWATKEQLDNYLFMLAEAEKRYHVKLGKELGLFHMQEEARGMVFWHDKGWTLYRTIEEYIRSKIKAEDYIEVKTPMLLDKKFWELSGHWEKYREHMFTCDTDDETLALKPMNCPCHVQIFNHGITSYKELPIRMAEFGSCHRYEPSGALHGLMRVRGFVQDDAHIFCMESQIADETLKFCNLLQEVYKDFGFTDVKVKFSDRPDVRAGSDETWDKAEAALKEASDAAALQYTINKGEGAFYGPKLEFMLVDALHREWQCGTLQVDFVLPERLSAWYIDNHGQKQHPVMLHRAIIGSFERFIGILIEHYAGKFPLWLAPVQVCVATVTNENDEYAQKVHSKLIESGIKSIVDTSADKVGYKIRHYSTKKIPVIAIVGKQEALDDTVNVRMLDHTETQCLKMSDFIALVQKLIYDKK